MPICATVQSRSRSCQTRYRFVRLNRIKIAVSACWQFARAYVYLDKTCEMPNVRNLSTLDCAYDDGQLAIVWIVLRQPRWSHW